MISSNLRKSQKTPEVGTGKPRGWDPENTPNPPSGNKPTTTRPENPEKNQVTAAKSSQEIVHCYQQTTSMLKHQVLFKAGRSHQLTPIRQLQLKPFWNNKDLAFSMGSNMFSGKLTRWISNKCWYHEVNCQVLSLLDSVHTMRQSPWSKVVATINAMVTIQLHRKKGWQSGS